jgi:hypothetical protein
VGKELTHFGFGGLLVGFGSMNNDDTSTPSTSAGNGRPASAATVGKRSMDSTILTIRATPNREESLQL